MADAGDALSLAQSHWGMEGARAAKEDIVPPAGLKAWLKETEDQPLEEMSDYVYTSEMGRLTSAEVILNNVKNGSGKIVVTGWDSEHTDNTVYCLTKIKSDVILQMTVLFPDYTDEADQLRKSYLTECFYRMCGFSNADTWRTYEDFVREAG